jgi:hypothetical protein
MFCNAKHHFQAGNKHIHVFDIAAGVHVNAFYLEAGGFYNAFNMPHLVHRYAKLGVDMAGAHFVMAAAHNMRVEADADRIRTAELIAELFQYGDVVDVDDDAFVFPSSISEKSTQFGVKRIRSGVKPALSPSRTSLMLTQSSPAPGFGCILKY